MRMARFGVFSMAVRITDLMDGKTVSGVFSMAVRIPDQMDGKTDGSIRGNVRVLHFPAKSNPQSFG
jgi:hypothetical protein